jgi:hypothetical protein
MKKLGRCAFLDNKNILPPATQTNKDSEFASLTLIRAERFGPK